MSGRHRTPFVPGWKSSGRSLSPAERDYLEPKGKRTSEMGTQELSEFYARRQREQELLDSLGKKGPE